MTSPITLRALTGSRRPDADVAAYIGIMRHDAVADEVVGILNFNVIDFFLSHFFYLFNLLPSEAAIFARNGDFYPRFEKANFGSSEFQSGWQDYFPLDKDVPPEYYC